MYENNYLEIFDKINEKYESEEYEYDEESDDYFVISFEECVEYFMSEQERDKFHEKNKNEKICMNLGELGWSEFDNYKGLRKSVINLNILKDRKIAYLNIEGFCRLKNIEGINKVTKLKIGKCPFIKDISSLQNLKSLEISSLNYYYTKEYDEKGEYMFDEEKYIRSEIKGIENLYNLKELVIEERDNKRKELLDIGNLRGLTYLSTKCSVCNMHLLKNLKELNINFCFAKNITRFVREIVKLSKINKKLYVSTPRM